MQYSSSIHTHTPFCDGISPMRAMAEAACAQGISALGFSPHSPLPYDNDWAMKESDFPAFFEECASLQRAYAGRLEIYKGIEWDADSPDIPAGLDYVIGAVHSLVKDGERFAIDYERSLLESVVARRYGGDFLALCADYFEAVVSSALRPRVDVVAHFDLVAKYNDGSLFDEEDPAYLRLATKALDAIFAQRKDLYFEINTGAMARAGRQVPYPAPVLLRALHERGARFIITCDCHDAAKMGYGYDAALKQLAALRRPRLYTFSGGKFVRTGLK